MRVETHDKFRRIMNTDATRVVIYDAFDNPICVVVNVEGNHHVAVTASHKKFNDVLKALGITKTVLVDHVPVSAQRPLIVE